MDFVIIANAWGAGAANPTSKHQIALELARQGHRVLWVEGSGMRRPSLGSGSDRARMLKKVLRAFQWARPAAGAGTQHASGGIWILSPFFIPLPSKRWVRKLNGRTCAVAAKFWARCLGFHDPILINYVPVLVEAMRHWRNACIYHCVDKWDSFSMYDSGTMRTVDEECCRLADVVIASSAELFERCRRLNDHTRLVWHGVNHAHFASALRLAEGPRPRDLPAGQVIGYFGQISEWIDRIDQELLLQLARAMPDAHIVLIGKADTATERLKAEPNIALLGPKPFMDLPSYVAFFNVGIIPFVVNELTNAINPIKLREMLAAGCPVVATALSEVTHYAGEVGAGAGAVVAPGVAAVRLARDIPQFVQLVKERIERPATDVERRQISQLVARETWEAKVDEILRIIRETVVSKGATP